ncbi:response regulator [Candidatus Woesearchaeota archaeon]|nr:response regulator [Candidatus Woesearchaeota archaeon]
MKKRKTAVKEGRKKPVKILHIDNDPETLKVVKQILEPEGFDVKTALSGVEGIRKASKENPDLVLLDVMMPSLSGWDTFMALRKEKKMPGVVFLTVLEVSNERMKRLKKEGIRDYILKPFDNKELVRRIKNALRPRGP